METQIVPRPHQCLLQCSSHSVRPLMALYGDLNFTFLMTSSTEHIFMCLFAICLSSGPVILLFFISKELKAHVHTKTWILAIDWILSPPDLYESESCVQFFVTPWTIYSPWNSPGQNTGVGSLSLLHGVFSIQGLNPGLLHCRQILYQQSHQGSPNLYADALTPKITVCVDRTYKEVLKVKRVTWVGLRSNKFSVFVIEDAQSSCSPQ